MASRSGSSTQRAERAGLGPALVAAACAGAWMLADPSSIDLAAQEYRAQLFRDEGFVAESPDWYGGFQVPGYSLLFPPLGAWLGVELVGALAAIAAAALFGSIAARHAAGAGRLAAYWFAIAITTQLLTGRITFTLGVAAGLGAIYAIARGATVPALVLGVATAAASPVAGVFLALAATAHFLAYRAAAAAAAAAAATLGVASMAIAWPTGGEFPFATSAFVAIPLFVAAGLLVVPRSMPALRWGLLLYGVLGIVAFAFENPFGANATRLGALFGGPVIALALWPRGPQARLALLVLALPLLYWQWVSSADSLISSSPDPLRDPARSAPLLERIAALEDRLPSGFRVHVPPTRTRWEAKHVAERHPIARGWLRQLESDDFDLFTDSNLTPAAYREWLAIHDVALIAVPDARPDYLAEDERELIDEGLPYLTRIWSNRDWRLYRVAGAGGG